MVFSLFCDRIEVGCTKKRRLNIPADQDEKKIEKDEEGKREESISPFIHLPFTHNSISLL